MMLDLTESERDDLIELVTNEIERLEDDAEDTLEFQQVEEPDGTLRSAIPEDLAKWAEEHRALLRKLLSLR
jgi:hypothetical protein